MKWSIDDEDDPMICALMSERSLAKDWLRSEEDEAWAYLQPKRATTELDTNEQPDSKD